MKFLAVDDSPLQLEYLVFQLKQASPSSEIRSCGDVGEVLRALEEGFAPDVAFLDIEMPDMTGLELAGKIRERQPAAQVVFVTACPQYALDSYSVHAQGYLLKPVTVEKIREELENLFRNVPRPGEEEADRLQVKCFGNFEVFFRGTPLNFRRSKAKELLAYLVMKQGGGCTVRELSGALFDDDCYDEARQNYLQKIISSMMSALRDVGMESVIFKNFNQLSVDASKLDCDYYRFLHWEPDAMRAYCGEFMNQYSWGEFTAGYLDSKTK